MSTATETLTANTRESCPECRAPARFVLVTGGKGGVGKTTVAANLAVALAGEANDRGASHSTAGRTQSHLHDDPSTRASDRGALFPGDPTAPNLHPQDRGKGDWVTGIAGRTHQSPLLVDLDLGLANLDLLLNLEKGPGLEPFLKGSGPIEEALVQGPRGLGVLTAGSGVAELARPNAERCSRLVAGVREVSRHYGIVVGDSPAGIGPDVLEFSALADRVLVVTTPDPAAMTDAYGLMKALDTHARDGDIEVPTPELFVNLASDGVEARDVAERLGGVCRRFLGRSPRLVGWMSRSRLVQRSVLDRAPIVLSQPRSLPAKSLERLARRFAGLVREPSPVGVS